MSVVTVISYSDAEFPNICFKSIDGKLQLLQLRDDAPPGAGICTAYYSLISSWSSVSDAESFADGYFAGLREMKKSVILNFQIPSDQ